MNLKSIFFFLAFLLGLFPSYLSAIFSCMVLDF